MKNKNYTIPLLLLSVSILCSSIFSCNSNTKFAKQEDILTNIFKTDKYFNNKKCIILIPAMGCGKCTQEIIEFSKSQINNDSLLFVYSDLTNKTDLIFSNIEISKSNFLKDSLSILISKGLVENKPVACFIKNGHISELVKFDDSNVHEIIKKIEN